MLKKEEELKLIARSQKGDREASSRLMKAFRSKIRHETLKYSGQSDEELINQAWLGFWDAVKGFDPDKGTRLWTYARWWVQRRIIEFLVQSRGLSDDERKIYKSVLTRWEQLAQELGQEPSLNLLYSQAAKQVITKTGWKKERASKAVANLLEAFDREQISITNDGEDGLGNPNPSLIIPSHNKPPWQGIICNEYLQQYSRKVQNSLKSQANAQKFITLHLLYNWDQLGYKWSEIVSILTNPTREMSELWIVTCDELVLQGVIPCNWKEICHLFPPPKLTVAAMKQWYKRAWDKVKQS